MTPAQTAHQGSHLHIAAPLATTAPSNERVVGRYDFEGGAYVRISAGGNIDTEEALDMVETLIQLKRKELETRRAFLTEGSGSV